MTPIGSRHQLILLRIVTESQQIFPDATVEESVPKHALHYHVCYGCPP